MLDPMVTPHKPPTTADRPRALAEIAAVLATAAIFVVLSEVFRVTRIFIIVGCCLLWAGYFLARIFAARVKLSHWGIRVDNLRTATAACVALVVVVVPGIVVFRLATGGSLALPPHALVVFGLYTLWELFQQLFVQALVADNLRTLGVRPAAVVFVVAVLFGAAHWPHVSLIGLTALAGAVWALLYFRTPNILPLSVSHALLGMLTYYWILDRDPWLEIFA